MKILALASICFALSGCAVAGPVMKGAGDSMEEVFAHWCDDGDCTAQYAPAPIPLPQPTTPTPPPPTPYPPGTPGGVYIPRAA